MFTQGSNLKAQSWTRLSEIKKACLVPQKKNAFFI